MDDSSISSPSKFSANLPRQFLLGGTKVEFPHSLKPYPSQLTCMAKAVTGARLGQNCLLESPTGSGKTMAMLCSLLAWQKQFKDEANAELRVEEAKWQEQMMEIQKAEMLATPVQLPPHIEVSTCEGKTKEAACVSPEIVPAKPNRMSILDSWSDDEENASGACEVICIEDSDDESCFKSPKKKHLKQSDTPNVRKSESTSKQSKEKVFTPVKNPNVSLPPRPYRKRVPKIFFATRTHKQIAQVVQELKRTPYRNIAMTILNSREHSCIRHLDEPYTSKTEMCKALLEKKPDSEDAHPFRDKKHGCHFKSNLAKFSPQQLAFTLDIEAEPWDIEDFVTMSKRIKVCPYFATRDLMSIADIVFCPYNYIVDPLIRQSMNLNLTDNIILFDEAHNIEDCFRESNSFKFVTKILTEAIKNCELGIMISSRKSAFGTLKDSLSIFEQWMKDKASDLKLESNRARERTLSISGGSFANQIETAGFDKKAFDTFTKAAEAVFAEPEDGQASTRDDVDEDELGESFGGDVEKRRVSDIFKPAPQLRTMVDGLKLIMARIFSENLLNRDDYNVVLIETTSRAYQEGPSEGGWRGKGDAQAQIELGLNFWCMNPAIGFADLKDARSVIVTSGTLSPMSSFQSELGAQFPHSLSTDHVISPSQVWVGSVSVGPRGKAIHGAYQNAITIDYQDEVGLSILQICSVVPFGVLCFFPSYASMDNVMRRWQMSGTWHKLVALKDVIVEPRQVRQFAEAMKDFDDSIRKAESSAYNRTQTGALLLAVCRGKVSEGIDFKDNHARAVITVSIPYPNVMDLNVKLKKQYNDRNQHRQLLPGNQWYEIQAFRAINQALGRCIRHKNDWGAIILLDARFSPYTKYGQNISKWAAKSLAYYDHWETMQNSLGDFVQRMSIRSTSAPQ